MKRLLTVIVGTALLGAVIAGCDLLDPTNTENPDVLEEDFLQFENAMQSWLVGMERQIAIALGGEGNQTGLIVPAEIASDNYVNTQTFFNQFMDDLVLDFTDNDVEDPFLGISDLRESAEFGLNVVAEADEGTTPEQLAELHYFKGIAHIYIGEWWHTAPADSAGPPVSSDEQFQEAISSLTTALDLTTDASREPGYHIALARAYRNLGDADNALTHAQTAISIDPDYARFARFDNVNGPGNEVQDALFTRGTFDDLQPLVRLDFLDPKYFIGATPGPADDEEADIAYVKAEEAYLIEAEVHLANNDVSSAKESMRNLLDLVDSRQTSQLIDAQEDRTQDNPGLRPMEAGWEVAFSPQDTFHTGLVIPRREPVQIPVISGTAVTEDVVDRVSTMDELVELLYRLRQEIFIAEGRRMYDLGVKWPVPEVEVINNPNIDEGSPVTQGQIPDFLPPGSEFDEWESIDYEAQEVVLLHNLNRIIAMNRTSDLVAPLF